MIVAYFLRATLYILRIVNFGYYFVITFCVVAVVYSIIS